VRAARSYAVTKLTKYVFVNQTSFRMMPCSHHKVLCLLAMALARSVRSCLSPLEIASVTISVLVLSSSSFELFDAPFEDVIPPPLSLE
jgi:hypothetical protein